MKLFAMENGNEVVYVQLQDLGYLYNESDIAVPMFAIMKFMHCGRIDETNRFDFAKFNRKEEVKFFKRINFIIDYGEFKNLTEEEIYEKETELYNTLKFIENKRREITEEEYLINEEKRAKADCFYSRYMEIQYMLRWINEIYNIRLGITKIKFPSSKDN